MTIKRRLTEAVVTGLKPAPTKGRVEIWDALVPGFGVRVTDKGSKSYVCYARFDGTPSRRKIGDVGLIGLAEAREKAREWLRLANEGKDPKALAEAARLAEEGRVSFAVAMEKYISRHVSKTRKARDSEREIRKEILPRFEKMALADISRRDIAKMIGEIRDRGALYQAHAIYGHTRTFFRWAIAQEEFGIEVSPCDRMQAAKLIGPKRHRTRVLADDEIRGLWRATETLGYPFGSLYRLILLTGCRISEASDARWPEFDLKQRMWTIPSERFKSGTVHLVPLSPSAATILEELPHWSEGDFVFSTRGGIKPVDGFSKAKSRLDALLVKELGREPEPYVIHDIRRTVRTRLSQLRVPTEIAELVIGHGRKGLAAVYDRHEALDERREALDLWANRLRAIVEPPPENVAGLDEARRAKA